MTSEVIAPHTGESRHDDVARWHADRVHEDGFWAGSILVDGAFCSRENGPAPELALPD